MTRPKRSVVWDEIADRLGRGRHTGRQEVHRPAGVSATVKRIALESAKLLVVNRHWSEVKQVYESELEFLRALEIWLDISDLGKLDNKSLLKAIQSYYDAHGLQRPGFEPPKVHSNGAEEPAMIDPEGRELFHGRPRPRKRSNA